MLDRKILILGSGAISSLLQKAASSNNCICDIVPLRKIKLKFPRLALNSYRLIVYTGYDHFSLFRNIIYIRTVVNNLKCADFTGLFIYLNTQGCLLQYIARDSIPAYDSLIPNRYIISKRIQSNIIKKSGIRYFEYYLPFVIGENLAQNAQLLQLAKTNGIELPRKGTNRFYYLHIDSLISEIFSKIDVQNSADCISVFIYSDYSMLMQKLIKHYGSSGEYLECRYNNAYNLPSSLLFSYLLKKFFKSIGALIYYLVKNGVLQQNQPIKSTLIPIIQPEAARLFSLDFIPPDEISDIDVMKI